MKVFNSNSFKNPLIEAAERAFPKISNLKIDHWGDNVRPVRFPRGSKWSIFGEEKLGYGNEYPPVISWKVDQQVFRYVLKPRFKDEHWLCFVVGGTVIKADYTDEHEVLMKLLKWSEEGYTADQMNEMLKSHRRDNLTYEAEAK